MAPAWLAGAVQWGNAAMRLTDQQMLAEFTKRMPKWQWHAMCGLAAAMQVVFAAYARILRI